MSLNRYIRIADRMVEFEAFLNDKQAPMSSSFLLETHMEELSKTWAEFRISYEQCLQDIESEADGELDGKGNSDEASEVTMVKAKYNSTYSTYCRCHAQLQELHFALMSPKQTRSPQSIPCPNTGLITGPCPQPGFKLPPCEIPLFSGDYSSWPTFRDVFTAVCSKNSRLSAVEKLFHLNQRTQGEPHDIVSKFPLTNENFELAWSNLSSRYENKRVLVNIQLKSLFNLPHITTESGDSIKKLQRDMNSCISLLKLYDIDVESWGPIFVFICSNRLPDTTLTLWEQSLPDKTGIPEWSELDSFLTSRHRTLESVSEIRRKYTAVPSGNSVSKGKSSPNPNMKNIRAFQNNVNQTKCVLCPTELHVIRKCPRFLNMDVAHRFDEIKKNALCINCFSKVHTLKKCTSRFSCAKCNKRHNTLLHRETSNPPSDPPVVSSNATQAVATASNSSNQSEIQSTSTTNPVIQTCFSSSSRGVLLGTALVNISHGELTYIARALVDSGSEGTFMSEKLFNTLRLPFKRRSATVSGLNNTISAAVQKECTFTLGSIKDPAIEIFTTALVVPHLSGDLPSRTIDPSIISEIPKIPLADPRFFKSSNIDLLIGADLLPSIMLSGIIREICGTLMAQETVFGWILTGPAPAQPISTFSTIVSYFCEISLDKEISRFWEVEDLPRKKFLSPEDIFCENLYTTTTRRNPNGRYEVSLPFKSDYPEGISIGKSRNCVLAQFLRNEARLMRNSSFKLEYDQVLDEYISLGHMSEIQSNDESNLTRHYYLPHHAVVKPESTTTKVRVVFNASSSSSNGVSLNDVLYTGPVLQQDLTILILKWRFFRYVFNGDITKMYRQIMINPEHSAYQRILFRRSPNDTIKDYELRTVTFGVNCAPFLAIRTMLQLADDVQMTHPLASGIIRNSMYVDDVLSGAHSIKAAIEARDQLITALKSAGFSIRKWTSNSKKIITDLPPDQLLNEDFLELDDSSMAKTLGIRWNARSDSFFFTLSCLPSPCLYTKREVLSQISKLFDPAGWLAPYIILAKMIMQEIWIERTDWDDQITETSLEKWQSFLSAYQYIDSVRIPRWFDYQPGSEIQFHGFSDASEKAYAAALYIRVKSKESVCTHLVCSKTKVAPLKTLSIPRLELCGATLLAEIIDHIIPQLQIDSYSIFCWTDSTIVLSWLAKPPCYWTTFVANRVSKITQVVSPKDWYHVRSESNPADLASRGSYPQHLVDNHLWWYGPDWLSRQPDSWPTVNGGIYEAIDIERKSIKVNFSFFSNFEDILGRFSSLPKALRVVAYVYRFFYSTHPNFRSDFHRSSKDVSSTEIALIQSRLIIMSQKASYPDEYLNLSAKTQIDPSSTILSLNPFIDHEGVMRVCGRLTSSPSLTYDERHPILLPYNCQFSRLLVRFIHDISLHGGNQLVLKLIRMKYWIPRAKNLIKAAINKCKPCVIYRHKCHEQLMSSLPPERTEISRPFTHTGLDFAGPFDIKSFSGRNCRMTKGYGSCFTKTGCKYCQGKHHSLLHLHPRLKKDKPSRRKQRTLRGEPEPKPSTSAAGAARNRSQKTESKDRTTPTETDYSNTSLSAILKQNLMTLLPTAVVKILSPKGERTSSACWLRKKKRPQQQNHDQPTNIRYSNIDYNSRPAAQIYNVHIFSTNSKKMEVEKRVINFDGSEKTINVGEFVFSVERLREDYKCRRSADTG
ncbi:uncharacterized protein LOC131996801 [Stomoxys calcitrans]|uniref:uncharacterized protein LOC131996801 n=1 Tax=Stomoxys calcitrans TaxID=35570 RepID=UPI0027E3525A|nr:uncharacterized protein LOC131996801 [Stomoxys calcitrans]